MDVTEFINSLPQEMFADSDPDYCPVHGWDCPGYDNPEICEGTWR